MSKQALFFLVLAAAGLVTPSSLKAVDDPPLDQIKLRPGFKIEVYAANVQGARQIALTPGGTLFVGSRRQGNVYAIVDQNKDQKADEVIVIAKGLNSPNGVAFRNGSLYSTLPKSAECSATTTSKPISGIPLSWSSSLVSCRPNTPQTPALIMNSLEPRPRAPWTCRRTDARRQRRVGAAYARGSRRATAPSLAVASLPKLASDAASEGWWGPTRSK